jgi:ABC-type multidrug transport system permease subunit
MRKVFAIAVQDLRVFLSSRSNLPGLLLTPVVMTIIIGLVSGGAFGGPAVRRLDVIDEDHSETSAELLASIRRANPGLTLCPSDNDRQDICELGDGSQWDEARSLDRVADGTSLATLLIPAGFGQAVRTLRPTAVTYRSSSEFGTAQAALEAIEAAVGQLNSAAAAAEIGVAVARQIVPAGSSSAEPAGLSAGIYQRALAAWRADAVQVGFELSGAGQTTGIADNLQQGLGQSVPGMGTMFVLMTVFGGMAALIVEKQEWTLQRLAVMPVAKAGLLAGKILGRFTLGLLQFLVIFAVGALLGMDFGRDPAALILLVIVYTLSVTAISFAVGSRLTNPTQASGLSLLLTLTLAPLGGAWWPLEISPRLMQIAGHVSPIAWAMEAFTKLTYENATLGDIWLQVLVLLGFSVGAFLIGIPRFRLTLE